MTIELKNNQIWVDGYKTAVLVWEADVGPAQKEAVKDALQDYDDLLNDLERAEDKISELEMALEGEE